MKKQRPITACLRLAIERLWSGRIEMLVDEQAIGQLVFVNGRIAWATAKGQSETLGTFLWRLGRLTREQLGLIQRRYKEAGGGKRLGALLEESGFMTRPMLRRALLLHTRSAVDRLMRTPGVLGTMRAGDFAAEESILFGPEEVLPSDWQEEAIAEWFRADTTQIRRWHRRTEENDVLESFAELPGYSAAAVVAAEGDVLSAHCSAGEVDMQMLAISIAATIESATRAVKMTLLGKVDILTLDSPHGGLTARWIDDDQRFLLLVLTEEGGNASLTRYGIKTALPALKRWLPGRLEALGIKPESAVEKEERLDGDGESFTATFTSGQAEAAQGDLDAFAHRESAAAVEREEAETESTHTVVDFEGDHPPDPFAPKVRPTTGDAFSAVLPKDKKR